MTVAKKNSSIASEIIKQNIPEFVEDNYLPYSYYVINSRALVRAEEGLKPVQRRILFGMYKMGLFPNSPMKKAATVSGNIMGNYHPHASSAIDGAIANLAQAFNTRVPLIAYKGSVGYTTGDAAAAPRYYEIGLNEASMLLLEELKDNVVQMIPDSVDGEREEPLKLPVRWPVGLINGTEGIAVGYASKIPPHNPNEAIDLCIYRLRNDEMTVEDIMGIMPGPDFPTGGELVQSEGIKEYYETGKGTVIVRGVAEIEPMSRGRHSITFVELPYNVSAEKVMEKISEEQENKRLTGISEVKDLSGRNTNGLKLRIIAKSGVNPKILLEEIFDKTPAESRYAANVTVLKDSSPRQVPILDIVDEFLEFRKEILRKKINHQIESLGQKIFYNEGLISVLLNVKKATDIIINAKDEPEATSKLMKEFKIEEDQAKYILELRLKKLTKSDREELKLLVKKQKEEIKELKKIISNKEAFINKMEEELLEAKNVIYSERRTKITEMTKEDLNSLNKKVKELKEAYKVNEPCTVFTLSNKEIVKMTEPKSLLPQLHLSTLVGGTKDEYVVLTKDGTGHRISGDFIPTDQPASVSVLGVKEEDFVAIGKVVTTDTDKGLLVVTNKGGVNIYRPKYPNGETFKLSNLGENEHIVFADWIDEYKFQKDIIILTEEGMTARFDMKLIRESGVGSGTVKGMGSDSVVSAAIIDKDEEFIVTLSDKTVKATLGKDLKSKGRGIKGVNTHRIGKEDSAKFIFSGSGLTLMANTKRAIELPEPSTRGASGQKLEDPKFYGYDV